jgi:hypothetical protein
MKPTQLRLGDENGCIKAMRCVLSIRTLVERFFAWCSRYRSPATVAVYRTRLKKFRDAFHSRECNSLTARGATIAAPWNGSKNSPWSTNC